MLCKLKLKINFIFLYHTLQQNEENFQFPQEHHERGMLVCLGMLQIMTLASCGSRLTF